MNRYKHLAQSQKYHIYQCIKLKMTQSAIAKSIGVNKSSISREIKRNTSKRMRLPSSYQNIKNGMTILKRLLTVSNGLQNKYQTG